MRDSFWILILAAILVAGVIGALATLRLAGDAERERERAEAAAREAAKARAESADADSKSPTDTAIRKQTPFAAGERTGDGWRPHRTPDEIRAAFLRLARDGDAVPWQEYRFLLRELMRIGTPEAIGVVLEMMENPEIRFPHYAMIYSELLMDVDDPRIFPAAERALAHNLEEGLDSWYDVRGFIRLVARQGGADGADILLSLMREYPEEQIATLAAHSLERLGDPSIRDRALAESFLDLIRDGHPSSPTIVEGLAMWDDPAVREELLRLTFHGEGDVGRRTTSAEAIGRSLDHDGFNALVEQYADAGSPEERSLLLHAYREIERNPNLHRETVGPSVLAILEEAVYDPSPEVWEAALFTVRESPMFHTPAMMNRLEDLLANPASPEQRLAVERALAEIQRR